MSKAGRALNVGDVALTDYSGKGMTRVVITARRGGCASQSGTMFQVRPALDRRDPAAWFDADWFEPAPADLLGVAHG